MRNAIALVALLASFSTAQAQTTMIGVVPTNGSTMLLKQFSLSEGEVVSGIQFINNDEETVFPEITLLRGPLDTVADGTVVAAASNVTPGAGSAAVFWSAPVTINQTGTYFVAIRFPAGPGKQGAGQGPAIGASDVLAPTGSYVTADGNQVIIPLGVDLDISLTVELSATIENVMGEGGGSVGLDRSNRRPTLELQGNTVSLPIEIAFTVHKPGRVSADLYDVSGRRLCALFEEYVSAGTHVRKWHPERLGAGIPAAGIYLLRFSSSSGVLTKKVPMVH